jgi:hypothetical protein
VTLLIEIDDPAVRAVRLREWRDLPPHLYARLKDSTRVPPTFDPRQIGADRYLKFPVRGQVPVAIGGDLPALAAETELTAEQRGALAADLAGAR